MTLDKDLITAARALVERVEYDCNGTMGKGGNGGLLNSATIHAAGQLRIALDRQEKAQAHAIGDQHPDALAVDRFAAAMKSKLAQKRAEGRGGWNNPEECSIEWLSELLRSHVEKADPVDVGNFAMMIHQRGGRICK
jgi:hypothetical protein